MVPCWKSIDCGAFPSPPVAFATLATSCGTPRHRRPLDTINRSGSARVAPRPFPVRHRTSKTLMVPPPPLPPLPPPRTRSARSSPDSENPGKSTYSLWRSALSRFGRNRKSIDGCRSENGFTGRHASAGANYLFTHTFHPNESDVFWRVSIIQCVLSDRDPV